MYIVEEWIKKDAKIKFIAGIVFTVISFSVLYLLRNYIRSFFTDSRMIFGLEQYIICVPLTFAIIGPVNIVTSIISFIDYRKTKAYRSLENLNYETLEDAEEEVEYDYSENQAEHIYEDKKIFISKEFIITKVPVYFMACEDLLDVSYYTKSSELGTENFVRVEFEYLKKPKDIFISEGRDETIKIVNILRTQVLNIAPIPVQRQVSVMSGRRNNR